MPSIAPRSSVRSLATLGLAPAILALLLEPTSAEALGFGAPITGAVGNVADHVAIADLNEDGRPDLLVTSYYENYVSVLLAREDGTWGPRTLFDYGSTNGSLAIGDIDRDGHLDAL